MIEVLPGRAARALAAALVALVLSVCPAASERVTVFAAASLADALAEIEAGFEAETGHDAAISIAGSSALARQIQRGAPADVFISASPDWMDLLERDGRLAPGTRRDLLTNALVLISADEGAAPVPLGADTKLGDLLGGGRLAMALVDAVPAGIYGRAALESLGLWEGVAPRVAQADNVRAALALVAAGAAPYGIVYATDAMAESRVAAVGTFPEASHPPIFYPAAAIGAQPTPGASAFLAYLGRPDARATFERQGFGVLDD